MDSADARERRRMRPQVRPRAAHGAGLDDLAGYACGVRKAAYISAVACHDVDPGFSCRIGDHGMHDVMRARAGIVDIIAVCGGLLGRQNPVTRRPAGWIYG
jgi:hypothetical protein